MGSWLWILNRFHLSRTSPVSTRQRAALDGGGGGRHLESYRGGCGRIERTRAFHLTPTQCGGRRGFPPHSTRQWWVSRLSTPLQPCHAGQAGFQPRLNLPWGGEQNVRLPSYHDGRTGVHPTPNLSQWRSRLFNPALPWRWVDFHPTSTLSWRVSSLPSLSKPGMVGSRLSDSL